MMLKETILKQRKFELVSPENERVYVDAKLYSLGSQAPYFSVTTQNGADHETILRSFPSLKVVVDLHLCDADGVPMHGVANLAYHLKEGNFDAAKRHMRGLASRDDLILVAGHAKIESDRVLVEYGDEHKAILRDLEAKKADLAKKLRVKENVFTTNRLKKDLTKVEEAIFKLPSPKKKAEEAYTAYVADFFDKLRPTFKQMADDAIAFLELPDFTADGFITEEQDDTTYAGFIKSRGIEFEIVSSGRCTNKDFVPGSTTYMCKFSTPEGNELTIPFHHGPALTEEPTAVSVLETLAMDLRFGEGSFEDYCFELGEDTDSRKSYAIWEACVKQSEDLKKLLGEDDYEHLRDNVGEDLPMNIKSEDSSSGFSM